MKFHFNIFQNKEISIERSLSVSCQLTLCLPVNFYISLMQYNSTLLGRQLKKYEICKNKIIQQYHTHISQNLTFCLPDLKVHQRCGTESSYIGS